MKQLSRLQQVLSVVVPIRVETKTSKYNPQIEVYKFFGEYRIVADNLTQSGGLVKTIWRQSVAYINQHHFKSHPPQRILILGLGAGSMVEHLIKTWPQTSITAIEIDPVMIELGNKYFHLNNYQQLHVVNADVFPWLSQNQQKFNLIMTDLYLGSHPPPESQSLTFLGQVKSSLTSKGTAVFNRLSTSHHQKEAQAFLVKLNQVFTHVKRIKTTTNWLLQAA